LACGNARVLEDHFAVLIEAPAVLLNTLPMRKPACRAAQEHGGACPQRRVRAVRAVDERTAFADAGVGDEAFLAIEDPFVAVAFRPELEAALGSSGGKPVVPEPALGSLIPWPSRKVSVLQEVLRKRRF